MNKDELIYELILYKYRGITLPILLNGAKKQVDIEKELFEMGWMKSENSDDMKSGHNRLTQVGIDVANEKEKQLAKEVLKSLKDGCVAIDDLAKKLFPNYKNGVVLMDVLRRKITPEDGVVFDFVRGEFYKN